MREIKFRAWDNGEMLYSDSLQKDSPNSAQTSLSKFFAWVGFRPEAIIMEYTGLKDKSGKEIYEGDIVRILYTDWSNPRLFKQQLRKKFNL